MSKEGSPELTKSWVVVDSERKSEEAETEVKDTSGLQEVTGDSDTDSISVISESGCSYKTDEEEFTPTEAPSENKHDNLEEEPDIIEEEPATPRLPESHDENKKIEKLFYFATSAFCAIILIGFSVAVQHYLQGASELENYDSDQRFPSIQNVKNEDVLENPRKRKNRFKSEELENKIAKLEENSDKLVGGDDDLKVEGNQKSNYKLNKNKNAAAKPNKENCDVNEKIRPDEKPNENYDKKVKELKAKEDYLREKEKFLIEKEHDLLKKEIKLNKEKQHYEKNKHDKKDESREKKETNPKSNKKYKHKEEKKTQKRFKFSDEYNKKRNISGHWYINLHEARDNMRQRKRSSFKRNKAHWYFQWMVDRARLRVK